jgi:hypothetical protein
MLVLAYQKAGSAGLYLAREQSRGRFVAVGDRPVWTAPAGASAEAGIGLRRDPQGRFHLICAAPGPQPSLLHATSEDLGRWSDPTVREVMSGVPGVMDLRDPGLFFDSHFDLFRVFWTARCRQGRTEMRKRIWAATTSDFAQWTDVVELFDPGYDVGEACVVPAERGFVMAFKDDRGRAESHSYFQAIRLARAEQGAGPFVQITALLTESGTGAPALWIAQDRWLLVYRHSGRAGLQALAGTDGRNWGRCESFSAPPEAIRGQLLDVPEAIARRL